MNISKPLDDFDTNVYNQKKGCERMKNFMNTNHNISSIEFASRVNSKTAKKVHTNRACHGLVLHTSGDRTYVFDSGKRVRAAENDITYLPKGANYIVENTGNGECYAINYLTSDDVSYEPFSLKAKNPSLFLEYYKKAERVGKINNQVAQMENKSLLYAIICALINEFEAGYAPKSQLAVLRPAIKYIDENFSKKSIDIPYLSEMCGISETYFRKLFLKAYGTSPIKYVRSLKIERAKALLSSGLYSVTEAAELSGWNDEAYFSREFKKTVGVSPSESSKSEI